MITVFPTLNPEELLYSACARYRDIFRFPGDRAVAADLFGSRQRTAVVDLPMGLEVLIARLPQGHPYTVHSLIRYHTLLPYYSHFLNTTRAERIEARMRVGGKGPMIPTLLGVGLGHVPIPSHLLFCCICAEEDINACGEPVWRRVHQLPGVFVCPDHGCALQQGAVRFKDLVGVFVYHSLQRQLGLPSLPVDAPRAPEGRLQWIAEQSLRLLQTDPSHIEAADLRTRHRALLHDVGLVTGKGRLRLEDLVERFTNYWGSDFLARMNLAPDLCGPRPSWLQRQTKTSGKGAGAPLRHLLLIGFYGISVLEFLGPRPPVPARPTSRSPEKGQCANPACPDWAAPDERSVARQLYLRTGNPYRCPICECAFEDFRIGPTVRFVETGKVWDVAFQSSLLTGTPLKGIVARFAISRELVFCHANQLGIWREEWENRREYTLEAYDTARSAAIEQRRAEWLRARADRPQALKTQLRQANRATWSWLQAHDNRWLLSNEAPPAHPLRSNRSPVDWVVRDQEVLEKTRAAVSRLLDPSHPPVWLTLAAIGREAGVRVLIVSSRKNLPSTNAYLGNVVEDVDAFTRRRIAWQAHRCIDEGIIPFYSDFLEQCGIEWRHRHLYDEDLHQQLRAINEDLEPPEAPSALAPESSRS